MQDRAERTENRNVRLIEAKREFHELRRRDANFALAVYRCRLIAIYGGNPHEVNNVIAFERR